MSSSDPFAPSSSGRRRKYDEAESIEGLAAPSPRKGARRRRPGGKRRTKTLPLLLGALGVAVVALVAVLVVQFVTGGAAAPDDARPANYSVHSSAGLSTLKSQKLDNRDLAEGELFEDGNEKLDSQGITFELEAKDLTSDCATAVWGAKVKEALRAGGCTQAARAGYTSDDYVGVAAMFNLSSLKASKAVAKRMRPPKDQDAEAPGFVTAPSTDAPFDTLGGGYSAATAEVSGHYLVVAWTQSTSSTSPEEKESLTSPLLALGSGFQDPLYLRAQEQEDTPQTGGEPEEPPAAAGQG